jgi:hypothetical protein
MCLANRAGVPVRVGLNAGRRLYQRLGRVWPKGRVWRQAIGNWPIR